MYTVISGSAGHRRDWNRFRSLFLPDARCILAVVHKGKRQRARVLNVEDYIRRCDPIFEKERFWESEKSRKTQTFGNIAHVFSTYESRREKNGNAFHQGINSMQLFNDATRWWIVRLCGTRSGNDLSLPPKTRNPEWNLTCPVESDSAPCAAILSVHRSKERTVGCGREGACAERAWILPRVSTGHRLLDSRCVED